MPRQESVQLSSDRVVEQHVMHVESVGQVAVGSHPQYASDVVIKDDSIGLSSHHGIHGHNNDDVTIPNVHVHSFETQ